MNYALSALRHLPAEKAQTIPIEGVRGKNSLFCSTTVNWSRETFTQAGLLCNKTVQNRRYKKSYFSNFPKKICWSLLQHLLGRIIYLSFRELLWFGNFESNLIEHVQEMYYKPRVVTSAHFSYECVDFADFGYD